MTEANSKPAISDPAITVAVSPRFEIFHALRLVLDPLDGVHDHWCQMAHSRLPKSFMQKVERFCANPVIWPNLADAVERSALEGSFFEVLKAQAELDLERLQLVMLESALQDPEAAKSILDGQMSFADFLKNVPADKKDWLGFLGLYPFDAEAPTVQFFERLIKDPVNVRDELLRILNEFWDRVFDDTWSDMLPSLERSAGVLERAVPTCSLPEIAQRAFLRVQFDEKAKMIRAVLGDYAIPYSTIERIHFLPSAFNFNRLWSVFVNPQSGKATVVFPYFDPEIALSDREPGTKHTEAVIVEPPLIFATLGNPTRFAMARILAIQPTKSVDLARRLDITKATVSHHVQKLRMAGLITEEYSKGAVWLSLRRDVIELLSTRTVDMLYGGKSY